MVNQANIATLVLQGNADVDMYWTLAGHNLLALAGIEPTVKQQARIRKNLTRLMTTLQTSLAGLGDRPFEAEPTDMPQPADHEFVSLLASFR